MQFACEVIACKTLNKWTPTVEFLLNVPAPSVQSCSLTMEFFSGWKWKVFLGHDIYFMISGIISYHFKIQMALTGRHSNDHLLKMTSFAQFFWGRRLSCHQTRKKFKPEGTKTVESFKLGWALRNLRLIFRLSQSTDLGMNQLKMSLNLSFVGSVHRYNIWHLYWNQVDWFKNTRQPLILKVFITSFSFLPFCFIWEFIIHIYDWQIKKKNLSDKFTFVFTSLRMIWVLKLSRKSNNKFKLIEWMGEDWWWF